MRASFTALFGLMFALTVFSACSDDDSPGPGPDLTPTVLTATGSIQAKVDEYRALVGDPDNGGKPGSQPTGRRELSWDGVPDSLATPNELPSDFFNGPADPLARGAELTTPGTSVQVSADAVNSTGTAIRFGNFNPSYSLIFQVFSAERLFSPIGSNVVDLNFFVPGTSTPAVVRGFGAVYTDIDEPQQTSFEFFDVAGQSLGTFGAPAADEGLSFLGIVYPSPVIRRVRIAYGDTALGPNDGGGVDVAVMDDFIYAEPQPAN